MKADQRATEDRRDQDAETKIIIKTAFKEASKEWLDEKFAEFGKWSAAGIAAGSLVALGYVILTMNGWTHKL